MRTEGADCGLVKHGLRSMLVWSIALRRQMRAV